MPYHERLPPMPTHIKITTINDFPYSEILNVNGTLVGRGMCFEFFDALVKKYNFTYTIVPPEKDVIGNENTGMIKQLVNKEVDMAVSFIPLIRELRQIVDFGDAIDEMDMTFLIPRPGTSATGTGLFAPFSERVWWAILFSIFVISPAVYMIIFLRSRFTECVGGEKFTFFMCIWWAYSALVKQGTIVAPNGDSVRLVFATWWIFITILSSFYVANLTAFLTLNKFTLWINSLDDLLYWRYTWWIVEGRSMASLLEYEDPAVEPLTTLKKWRYGYYATDYNMSLATILKHADRRVFIVDRTLANLAIQEDYHNQTKLATPDNFRCRYSISDKIVFHKTRSFAFPKGSILRKHFRYDMMAVLEHGFMDHYRQRRTFVSQVCPLDIRMIERQLKVSDLEVTYRVCFHNYLAAGCLWALEVLVWLLLKFVKWCKGRKLSKIGEIKGTDAPVVEDPDKPAEPKKQSWSRSPPPTYEMSTEGSDTAAAAAAAAAGPGKKTMSIQGREYDVVREETGDQRLIPTNGPSNYLFQYMH